MTDARTTFFVPGQSVWLEVGDEIEYRSRLEAVLPDALVVGAPMRLGEYILVPPGTRVLLAVERHLNPYFFETVVLRTETLEGQPVLVLQRPPDEAARPLRQYVRVPVVIPHCTLQLDEEERPREVTLLDLSAGGALVATHQPLPVGATGVLTFPFGPGGQRRTLPVQVRRCREHETATSRTYRASLEFHGIGERDREQIIHFVLARQRELRRRGLI